MTVHQPGKCVVCDEDAFEILAIHLYGALKGRAKQIGAPFANACRVDLVLLDGRRTTVTMHRECIQGCDIVAIWGKLKAAYRFERDHWREFGAKPFTRTQMRQAAAYGLDYVSNVPIGLYTFQPWSQANA